MRPELPEAIEEFRDTRWRREDSLRIENAFEAERFIEVDQVKQSVSCAQDLSPIGCVYRPHVGDPAVIEVGSHLAVEVFLVLDDAGDDQWSSTPVGDVNGVRGAFIRVYSGVVTSSL